MKHDIPVLVLATVAGFMLGFCVLVSAKLYSPRACELLLQTSVIEERLPPFEVEGLAGGRWTSEGFKGRKYLIFFGDSGCPFCKDFYPDLRRAQQFISVIFVGRGDRDGLVEMAEKEGFAFPVTFDSLHTLSRSLKISTVPAAILVDEDGVARYRARAGGAAAALVEYVQRATEVAEE